RVDLGLQPPVVEVGGDDAGAVLDQPAAQGRADPSAGTRDDGDAVVIFMLSCLRWRWRAVHRGRWPPSGSFRGRPWAVGRRTRTGAAPCRPRVVPTPTRACSRAWPPSPRRAR